MDNGAKLKDLLDLLGYAIDDLGNWSVYHDDLYNEEVHYLRTIKTLIETKEEEREMNSVIGYPGQEEVPND